MVYPGESHKDLFRLFLFILKDNYRWHEIMPIVKNLCEKRYKRKNLRGRMLLVIINFLDN